MSMGGGGGLAKLYSPMEVLGNGGRSGERGPKVSRNRGRQLWTQVEVVDNLSLTCLKYEIHHTDQKFISNKNCQLLLPKNRSS